MSRLERAALLSGDAARDAAWEAFLSGIELTWWRADE